MKPEINVSNISQIRQIPEDLLSNAVLNGEPLLDYLRNISIFSADIISADWEGENISVWNLRRNIFVGNVNEEIRKYWMNTSDC